MQLESTGIDYHSMRLSFDIAKLRLGKNQPTLPVNLARHAHAECPTNCSSHYDHDMTAYTPAEL
eukprot:scaffold2678_cov271-Chaetoceros_neogracile.AAC.6